MQGVATCYVKNKFTRGTIAAFSTTAAGRHLPNLHLKRKAGGEGGGGLGIDVCSNGGAEVGRGATYLIGPTRHWHGGCRSAAQADAAWRARPRTAWFGSLCWNQRCNAAAASNRGAE
jgi:hypothetical protein